MQIEYILHTSVFSLVQALDFRGIAIREGGEANILMELA